MVTRSRITSIYVLFVSLALAAGLSFLAFNLISGYNSSKKTVAALRQDFESGAVKIYDKQGRLDSLSIENIYRNTNIVDFIVIYRQKNIIVSGGNEPSIHTDKDGIRQYKHYWWQKLVRTHLPDPNHDQNFSVDMLVDVIPLSTLKKVLSFAVMFFGVLFSSTLVYYAVETKRYGKKLVKHAAAVPVEVPLILEKAVEAPKKRIPMDIPLETILNRESLDEFFVILSDLDSKEEEERAAKKSAPVSSSTLEEDDSGFFDIPGPDSEQETGNGPSESESVEETIPSDVDLSYGLDLDELPSLEEEPFEEEKSAETIEEPKLENNDVEEFTELEDFSPEITEGEEAAKEKITADFAAEAAENENFLPDLSELLAAADVVSKRPEEVPPFLDLEELEAEIAESEEEILEDTKPSSFEELEEVTPEVLEEPELEEVTPEVLEEPELEEVTPEVLEEPELEEVTPEVLEEPELEEVTPEVLEEPELEEVIPEVLEEESSEDIYDLPDLDDLLDGNTASSEEEMPVLEEEDLDDLPNLDDLLPPDSLTSDVNKDTVEDLIDIDALLGVGNAAEQDLEEDLDDLPNLDDLLPSESGKYEDLDDLPNLEDLLGPDTVARQDDRDDLDDLPNLDNLLLSEEMEESGIQSNEHIANAIELSPEMLEELTSTPDVGLKNLSFDEPDEDFASDMDEVEDASLKYMPSFDTDSRFPEPPLLKGMATHQRTMRPRLEKEKMYAGQEGSSGSIFKFSKAELNRALESTKWIEPLSKILLDAEEMEEDFSLLVFTLADDAGISYAEQFFSEEHGLSLHTFSENSYGVWLTNTDLEGSYGIAGEFSYFMEEHKFVTAIGLSSKSERLVRSEHLLKEAFHALTRSVMGGGGIVGFRPDPRKYARVPVRK